MTANIIIRSATPEDLPTLLTFEQGIIRAERPYDHMLKPDPISYYDVGVLIADPDAEVAVAEIEGALIGSGYARRKPSVIIWIQQNTRLSDFFMSTPSIADEVSTNVCLTTCSRGRARMICRRSI